MSIQQLLVVGGNGFLGESPYLSLSNLLIIVRIGDL